MLSNALAERQLSFAGILKCCSVISAGILTTLILVPFAPSFPTTGLDASWVYALNVAVADKLRFGKDIIFTFGPFASAYTRLYSPQTDAIMMVGSFLITGALTSGLFFVATDIRRPWLLIFPLAVSQFALLDGTFITLPALLVWVCDSDSVISLSKRTAIFILASACGILLLIKGSTMLPVFVCIFLSTQALWATSKRDAILPIATTIVATVAGWLWTGQSLGDLPLYFRGEELITAGYSDGMSTTGRDIEVLVYMLTMGALYWTSRMSSWTTYWRVGAALAVTFFVAFKAGFVRHDGHAIIAGTVLFLIGYFIFLRTPKRIGLMALALGTFGWLVISARYVDWHPRAVVERVYDGFVQSAFGLEARFTGESILKAQMNNAVADIRRTHPLPIYPGTSDIYPINESVLIASGSNWTPRPVFQSYSAYTPDLLSLNRDYLIKSPPDTVYFDIDPIDGRYPSLEDSLSWPLLLSRYEPIALVGNTAILQKRKLPRPMMIAGPIVDGQRALGTEVNLPAQEGPLWAEIDLEPTLLGSLASAAYKNPLLFITLKYDDGSIRTYRYIAGMGKAGFLLSPTIQSGRDFVGLQSQDNRAFLARKFPTGFTISGKKGTSVLWAHVFDLKLYEVEVSADPLVDKILFP